MVWERREHALDCRIKTERPGNVFDEAQWDTMKKFMVRSMLKLEEVMEPWLAQIQPKLQ